MPTLKEQIGETEEEIAGLTGQMEAAKADIVAAAAEFAAAWWPEEARRALHIDSRRAAELEEDGLAFLKADVEGLVENAAGEADRVLEWPGLWPHLGNPGLRPWRDAAVGRALDPAMRRLLAKVLPILIRYRLEFPDRSGRPITDRYPHGVEVPEALTGAVRTYHGLAGRLRPAAERLAELETLDRASELAARWKDA
jgi:hypothetical protein